MISLPSDVVHKIAWCEKLHDQIRRGCDEYAASSPASVEVFADPELNAPYAQTGPTFWQLKTMIHSSPPLDLAFLVGDFIQNLRSALDYFAHALVTTSGGRPPTRGAKTSFPVVPTRDNPLKRIRVEGCISDSINELVEFMQPFNDDPPEQHPLFRINFLANEYKHRELRFSSSVIGYPSYFAIADRREKPFTGVAMPNLRYMTDGDRLDPLMGVFPKGVLPEGFGEFVIKLSLDLGRIPITEVCAELEFYMRYVTDFLIPTFREHFQTPWRDDLFTLKDVPVPARLSDVESVDEVIMGFEKFHLKHFGAIGDSEVKLLPLIKGLNSEELRGW